jgi:hypothetical protein
MTEIGFGEFYEREREREKNLLTLISHHCCHAKENIGKHKKTDRHLTVVCGVHFHVG